MPPYRFDGFHGHLQMGSVSSIFREQRRLVVLTISFFLPSCGCMCVCVWISRFVTFLECDISLHEIFTLHFSQLPSSNQERWDYWNSNWLSTSHFPLLYKIYFLKSHIRIIPTQTSIYILAILSISPSSGLMTTRDIFPSGKIPSVLVRFIVTKVRASKRRSGWAFWIVRIT